MSIKDVNSEDVKITFVYPEGVTQRQVAGRSLRAGVDVNRAGGGILTLTVERTSDDPVDWNALRVIDPQCYCEHIGEYMSRSAHARMHAADRAAGRAGDNGRSRRADDDL